MGEANVKAPALRRRSRWLVGVAAVAALAVVAAACDTPIASAGTLFNDWVNGNQAAASSVATPSAVSQMFAKHYVASDGWFFDKCEGTAGNTFCTWLDRHEN